jgi:carbonic anhydrase
LRSRQHPAVTEPEAASSREVLLAGVQEYHDRTADLVRPIMAELAIQQTPQHLFITCVDSRVVPNIITASGPGDLFIARNIANLVPPDGSMVHDDSVAAVIEYAVSVLKISTITVCGHSNCGGMAALLAGGDEIEHLSSLSRWLKHGHRSLARYLRTEPKPDLTPLATLCQINVIQQLDNLMTYPWLSKRVEAGELDLVGMYFDLESATVHVLEPGTEEFRPVGVSDPPKTENDLLEADRRT